MKLRNKKTGGIVELDVIGGRLFFKRLDKKTDKITFNSLAELNEEWEDYEEPKDNNYWYIDDFARIQFSSGVLDEIAGRPNNWMIRKSIGNYFDTREEAEKAVEKLKAWKRLKDNGFKFCGWVIDHKKKCGKAILKAPECMMTMEEAKQFYADIDILFEGEE